MPELDVTAITAAVIAALQAEADAAAPVVIEHVPAAAITAAPVAPVVPAVAPAVAPAAPAAPAAATAPPIVIEIPFGRPTPKAKGFTQFEDIRDIPTTFSVAAGHVRTGKLYIPPAALVGRKGEIMVTIVIS